MKTLLVIPWDGERGGVVSVVQNLAKYLRDCGHEILFFYPESPILLKTKTNSLSFPAVALRITAPFGKPRPLLSGLAFPVLFPIILGQLIWLIRKHHIRVINVHYPLDSFFYFGV